MIIATLICLTIQSNHRNFGAQNRGMQMKKLLLGALLAGAVTFVAPAGAAEITYTLQGTFDVNFNKVEHDGVNITFTGIGDTDAVFLDGSSPSNSLTSLVASVDGVGNFTLPAGYTFFVNPTTEIAGIYDTTITDIFDVQSDAFGSYDAKSNLGPISVVYPDNFFPGGDVAVDGGIGFIVGASNLTFAAVVSGTPPIGGAPEPAVWAMVLTGFFGLGAMVRRKKLNISRFRLAN